MKITQNQLLGLSEDHLVSVGARISLHKEAVSAWEKLKEKAKTDGLELSITVGFRDFEKQKKIWNEKAERSKDLKSVLRQTSLPGLCRYHWGTDFDVYDRNIITIGCELKPSSKEGGPFSTLNQWLEQNLKEFQFFRPYRTDHGGLQPVWWEISYAPLAEEFMKAHKLEWIESAIKKNPVRFQDEVLKELPEIFKSYFQNIDKP